ncbi:YlxR family protein [Mycolicibacterium wolinskyi]|uniref:YlxR family protein n=1 Tax=Mycolicibacterium TaxID=1866885 RepID=UPI000DA13D79|nr:MULTISPECIES: YlxR family protein [Mycolicibacterium]MCV7286162.1 YlxR family protein [Mycolicibacterium wolinskyi]MCV7293142.1 YlxR family protein [Mycolicibacterium goodii]
MIQRETPASTRERSSGTPAGPVRTCIGCRKRELAAELLRVVAVTDGNGECAVTVDTTASLPGRGAWLHPDQQCAQVAVRRRAFARALRITGSPDTSAVVAFVERLGTPDHPGQENR